MKSASIQICGTGSGVGKSVIVAALCRIFLQDGYKVAPFKAQNMALNSYVTLDGKEMGRAQVTQAQASGIEPTVDMNPILIKPNSDTGAQIIVRGKPIGNMSVAEYTKYKNSGFGIVRQSLRKLLDEYEVVVMEGAGSPAEINLKSHDIVNLKMAEYAKAAVILVGDIDKGGVFAWIVGTLELLSKKERKMIKGIIINKFRGDKTLLMPGIEFLEKRTGIKVLGIVPYYRDINIPEEDAIPLNSFKEKDGKKEHKLNIDVIYLPHISNFTDFDALEREDDVRLRYVKSPQELEIPDMIIIPGTKNTISDLKYLKKCGLAKKIKSIINSNRTTTLVGICGGYQMLGNKIFDKDGLESKHGEEEGLKLLPVETNLKAEKTILRIKAKNLSSGIDVSGYEIHHGSTKIIGGCQPAFQVFECNSKKARYFDGARSQDKRIFGTYIHGLFDTTHFRRNLLNTLRKERRWPIVSSKENFTLDKEFDKLAKLVRDNIDVDLLYKILRKKA
ncbi:MAG: cobyric acid synthase [Candidatus Omnitrophota bacterium]